MKTDQKHPKAVIVIFGATGDLAKRKLYPSIHRLYKNGQIGKNLRLLVSEEDLGRMRIFGKPLKSPFQQAAINIQMISRLTFIIIRLT